MKVYYQIVILLIIAISQDFLVRSQDCGAIQQEYGIAEGYKVNLIANNLTSPRGVIFDSDGALLVVEKEKGISRLYEGCNNYTLIVDQEDLNHGIWLQGDTLYASSDDALFAWDYPDISNRRTLVTGMTNSDHVSRTLEISPQAPNLMIISRGSAENLDESAWDRDAGTSQIRSFNLEEVPPQGYDWTDGGVIAWGVRNEVGIAIDWQGNLWGVENSADNLERDGERINQEQPGEKLNFFGDPADPQDKFYGYPACYAVWEEQFNLQTGQQFALNPNNTFNDETCNNEAIAPVLLLEPHTAPLDMKFAYGPTSEEGIEANGDVWVTLHGSWNAQPPTGYKLVVIGMENVTRGDNTTLQPRANSTSQQGYTDIFWNQDNTACPQGCFRPVGLAFDQRGRAWMSSDTTGELFIISRAQEGEGSTPSAGGSSQSEGSTPDAQSEQTSQDGEPAQENGAPSAGKMVADINAKLTLIIIFAMALFTFIIV